MISPTAEAITPERLLHRIDLQVVRRLDGRFHGDHRSPFHGPGLDFADLRDYQPDDDVRHIDWNVTARMDRPFVREFHEDRELTAWLLVDRSPSMSFGSTRRTKAMAVAELTATVAQLLTRRGNRVGAAFFQAGIDRIVEPATGRPHVLRLVHDLMRPHDGDPGFTDLGRAIAAADRTIRRRSLVFVVSDFVTSPGWERAMRLLTRRHDVIAVHVVDPDEEALPEAGVLVLQDAESGEQLTVDTDDPAFRDRYASAVAQRRSDLRASTVRAGVDLHRLDTDGDLVEFLVRLASRRPTG